MKRKTLVVGMILALSLAAACGSKAPVAIEAPTSVSDTEARVSAAPKPIISQKDTSETGETEEKEKTHAGVSKTEQEPFTNPDAINEYDSNGRIVKSEVEGQGYDIFAYDEAGNISEQKCYDEAGELINTITNEYDENGNVVKSQDLNSDGSESSVLTYTYDSNGYLIEIYSDYGNGDYEKDLYKRDDKGRELEYRFVSGTRDGETEVQRLVSEYDDYGNVTYAAFYSMGEMRGEHKYVYTYDNAGRILKKETYTNDELSDVEEYSY